MLKALIHTERNLTNAKVMSLSEALVEKLNGLH